MRDMPADKIEGLVRQYPVLRRLLNEANAGLSQPILTEVIVDRMDENLLYYVGNPADGQESGVVIDPERNWEGTTTEELVLVSPTNELITRHPWPRKRSVRVDTRTRVKDIIGWVKPVHALGYIVRVWVYHWYKKADERQKVFEIDPRRDQFQETWIRVIVSLPPPGGVHGLQTLLDGARIERNVRINGGSHIIDLALSKLPENKRLMDQLDALTSRFVRRVVKTGLSKAVDDEKKARGMSGEFGDIKLMTYVFAGRLMITLKRGDDQISWVGSDTLGEEDTTGLQSVEGTYDSVEMIVHDLIERWEAHPLPPSQRIHADEKIGIG